MTSRDRIDSAVASTAGPPPALAGSYEDAVTLRRWSFRQRTPMQRLEWLTSILRIAYQRGALKPRHPPASADERSIP